MYMRVASLLMLEQHNGPRSSRLLLLLLLLLLLVLCSHSACARTVVGGVFAFVGVVCRVPLCARWSGIAVQRPPLP